MLPRALESLRSQTFKDWVCEVHNDDPVDKFPEELVARVADPRISVVNHPVNLGGAATMNAFYAPCKEEFISILEDDNWWEPEFLEEMLRAADKHPHVTVFWANMNLWEEKKDGSFKFTGKTTYPAKSKQLYEEFWWPDPRQIMGAVHSNGACLIRSTRGGDYRIPEVPLSANIELFRERLFPYPLLLIFRPLANFTNTLQTDRTHARNAWGLAMAMAVAAFFRHAEWTKDEMEKYWKQCRSSRPPCINHLLNAAFLERKAQGFFGFVKKREVLRWIIGLLRRPGLFITLVLGKQRFTTWWKFLDGQTRLKFQEAERARSN